MAQLLVPNLFVPDEIIITKGYYGEEMYVIKNGSVVVYLKYADTVQQLAVLQAGNFFGEGALLKGKSARRGANVSAITYSLVYSLHVDDMSKLLPRYPKVQRTIQKIAADRDEATASLSVRSFGGNGDAATAVRTHMTLRCTAMSPELMLVIARTNLDSLRVWFTAGIPVAVHNAADEWRKPQQVGRL